MSKDTPNSHIETMLFQCIELYGIDEEREKLKSDIQKTLRKYIDEKYPEHSSDIHIIVYSGLNISLSTDNYSIDVYSYTSDSKIDNMKARCSTNQQLPDELEDEELLKYVKDRIKEKAALKELALTIRDEIIHPSMDEYSNRNILEKGDI